ncbi:MAG: hypothetical protein AB7R90_22040, partial [Reyranellaceae bacterium]
DGVPFFMKQMTKKAAIPEDLMVRQWPLDGSPIKSGMTEGENQPPDPGIMGYTSADVAAGDYPRRGKP